MILSYATQCVADFCLHATQCVANTTQDMSTATIDEQLGWFSRDTGIPKKELRRMCTAAGLEQLQKGELKVSMKPKEETKPKK